jgi:hypothetical protein
VPGRQDVKAGGAYVELYLRNKLAKGLRGAAKQLKGFSEAAASAGRKILAVGAAGIAGFGLAVKAASSLEETMNKFNVVFGDSAGAVKAWGNDFASSVGRGQRQIAEFMAGTQDLLVPLGFAADNATALSKSVTALAVDLASFNNMAEADVVRDLHAALTGSGEVMKKYGVIVSEAAVKQELLNQGMDPKTASNQAKVQARLNIIMRGTTAAQGDAIRSLGSFANQTKALRGRIEDAAAAIGTALLPVVTPLVTKATAAVKIVSDWIAKNERFTIVLSQVAVGVAAAGIAILGLSGAANAASILATTMAASLGVIMSPVTWIIAGMAALGYAILFHTETGVNAIEWLGKQFQNLKAFLEPIISGIKDALSAGDLGLAAEIGWLGIKVAFQKGANVVMDYWRQFVTGIVRMFSGAIGKIVSMWRKVNTTIAEGLVRLGGKLGLLGNLSAEDVVKTLQEDASRASSRDAQAIEKWASGDAMQEGAERDLAKLTALQDQLSKAREQAAMAAVEAEMERAKRREAATRGKPSTALPSAAKAVDESSSIGTFSAFAAMQMGRGPGKQVKLLESIDKGIKTLNKTTALTEGLFFLP